MSGTLLISALHFSMTVLLAAVLLAVVFRRSPIPAIRSFFLCLRQERDVKKRFCAFLVLIGLHLLLVVAQKGFSFGGIWDLTPLFSSWEMPGHLALLDLRLPFARYFFCCAYFFVFPALPLVVLHVLDFSNHDAVLLRFLSAMNLCLAISFAFFCLFKVEEVWMTIPDRPLFIRGDFCRRLLNMRSLNYPGNCFPSLHAALSVITCFFAARLGFMRLRAVVFPLAACVVLSTLFLSVHWFLDVFAGIVLGVACSLLAERMEDRFSRVADKGGEIC